jgi:hypothetical protein
VIRFSAFLVVVAVGLLVAGVVTSKLLLVYIAIGVAGVALLALGVGAAVNWRELTGKPGTAEPETLEPSAQEPAPQAAVPESVTSPAAAPATTGSGWPATVPSARSGPSQAGHLPASGPPWARPASAPASAAGQAPTPTPASRPADAPLAPAAFTPRREDPARGVWQWRDDSIQVPSAAAPAAPEAPEAPAPSRAEPASAARRDQSPVTEQSPDREQSPAAKEQSSAQEQSLAGAQDAAKPADASQPEPEPAPDLKPPSDPEPVSEAGPAAEQAGPAEPTGPDPSMEVTVVPGVPRYHNATCILIRFMGDSDLDKMTLAAARKAGCTPCRACLPDQPERSAE